MKIGKELKAMRENVGLSQAEVGKEMGYKTSQIICNFERSISFPPVNSIKKLANLYNVDVNYLKQLIYESSVDNYSARLKKRLWP